MRVLIAPDSFKGTLSATEASMAMSVGLKAGWPALHTDKLPLADGGEGTLEALLAATGGTSQAIRVHDTFGEVWSEHIGLLDSGDVVVEASLFCGRCSREHGPLDPLLASSRGLGEAIDKALAFEPRRLLVGLGGSVSIDGGLGLMQALGATAVDSQGREVTTGGCGLGDVRSVDIGPAVARLAGVELVVLCDVNARLLGEDGARLYMAQKGADDAMAQRLALGLENLAAKVSPEAAQRDGAGAAGGLGFALSALGGQLVAGAPWILAATDAHERIAAADIVVTGEGRLDAQTAQGKLPHAVGTIATAAGKRTFAICGCTALSDAQLATTGFERVFISRPAGHAGSRRPPFLQVRDAARELGAMLRAENEAG